MAETRKSRKRSILSDANENTERSAKRKAPSDTSNRVVVAENESSGEQTVVSDVNRDDLPELRDTPGGFKKEDFTVWDIFRDDKPQSLSDATEMIEILKEHLQEVIMDEIKKLEDIEHILSPHSSYTQMLVREMGGSNQLARRLRMRIDAVAAPLYEEVTTESLYNHVLSQTLRKYIKLVDTLSTIKDVGALENSYNLALILKRWWWNPDKGWSREEFLPSTPEAGLEEFDKMLSGLIQRRRDAGQAWDVEGDLREMEREWGARAVPREPSPNPWFPESRRLLEEIMGKDSEADDSDEE